MSGAGGQGRLSRLGIGFLVTVSALLALVAVFATNWLAGRPGLRVRMDLTRQEQNTLSTAARGVVERLEEDISIDVFFRPEDAPLTQVAFIAQERTRRLLGTFRDTAPSRIELVQHDMGDPQAVMERLRELRIQGFENAIVVSVGDRREVLTLRRDLATFDPGKPPPDPRPARLLSFDAERAFVRALLEVTSGERREVYFTAGHGERDLFAENPQGLSRLAGLLGEESLRPNRWSPLEDGDLPEDCVCLTIVAPVDPLAPETIDAIEEWVRSGGRLVVAAHSDDQSYERSNLGDLLERFGIEVQPGTVCEPHRDPATGLETFDTQQVSLFAIHPDNLSQHPLLEPIRLARRSFLVAGSHPVRLVRQPPGGSASVLFRSMARSWLEAQRSGGAGPFNWRPDEDEVQGRRFDLGVAAVMPVEEEDLPEALEQRPEARLVVLGTQELLANALFESNADFLRNVYNWVLDREYRILISPRDPAIVRFPIDAVDRITRVTHFAWGYLPGLCVVLGLLTAFLRARGGPRQESE